MLDRFSFWIFATFGCLQAILPSAHSIARPSYQAYLKETNYDMQIRPAYSDGAPTLVSASLGILELRNLDLVHEELRATLLLRLFWKDDRLAYDHLANTTDHIVLRSLSSGPLSMIWEPDTYFVFEREGNSHDISFHNQGVVVYRDGSVMSSSKYSVAINCPLNLRIHPFDVQYCPINIMSYSYTSSELQLSWHNDSDSSLVYPPIPPFELLLLAPKRKPTELTNFLFINSDVSMSTGLFSHIGVVCVLSRDLTFEIFTTYLPSCFIMLMAIVSFWISPEAVPARVSLGVTSVLTQVSHSLLIIDYTPRVSYIKAGDIWMAASWLFLVFAFVEFAVVNQLIEKARRTKMRVELNKKRMNGADINKEVIIPGATEEDMLPGLRWKRLAMKVDRVCRIAFPLFYLIFVISYWITFMTLRSQSLSSIPEEYKNL